MYELATSLMQEKRKLEFDERARRVRQALFNRLNIAPQPASLFYFRLTNTH